MIGKHRQTLDLDLTPANPQIDSARLSDPKNNRRLHTFQVERPRRVSVSSEIRLLMSTTVLTR